MPKLPLVLPSTVKSALLIDSRSAAVANPTYVSAVSPALCAEAQQVIDGCVSFAKAAAARAVLGLSSPKATGLEGLLVRHVGRLSTSTSKLKQKSRTKAKAWASGIVSGPEELRAHELGELASIDLKAPGALDGVSPIRKEVAKALLAQAKAAGLGVLRDSGAAAPTVTPTPVADIHLVNSTVEFQLDWVVCNDISGTGIQEWNADDVLLGGLITHPNGWTETFNLGKIGTFDHTGQVLDWTPDKVLARFDAPVLAGGNACSVLVTLMEQDYGSFPDWLNDVRHEVMQILSYLIGGGTGPEDSFLNTPEAWTRFIVDLGLAGAIGGPVAFLSLLATAIVASIFNAIRDAWNDDLIGTQPYILARPEPISTFRSGSSYSGLVADFIGSAAHYRVRGTWHLLADGVVDHYRAGPLDIVKVVKESARGAHPRVDVLVPPGYKVIGGGACANWDNDWNPAGSLLTEAYPSAPSTWTAAAKDHMVGGPCTITAVAYGVKANGKELSAEDYQIKMVQSPRDHKVSAAAVCDSDFTLVGGGARVRYDEPGSLLTSSYFDGKYWRATAQEHAGAALAILESYAVGIRTSVLRGMVIHSITATSQQPDIVPRATAQVPDGMVILGGGGLTQTAGPGVLLTTVSAGENRYFTVTAKDHVLPSPGTARAQILAARIDGGADLPTELGAASQRVRIHAPAPRTGRNAAGEPIDTASGTVTRTATLYPSLSRPAGYTFRWAKQVLHAGETAEDTTQPMPPGAADRLAINVSVDGPADFDVTYRVWWQRT